MQKLAEEHDLPIDGIVFTFNDVAYCVSPKPLDAFSHMIHEEVRCCDGGRFGPVKQ